MWKVWASVQPGFPLRCLENIQILSEYVPSVAAEACCFYEYAEGLGFYIVRKWTN